MSLYHVTATRVQDGKKILLNKDNGWTFETRGARCMRRPTAEKKLAEMRDRVHPDYVTNVQIEEVSK